MTLTTRLTTFFLVSLAVVLVGFSAALYLLARARLYGQADERLAAATDTLLAAAEIEPDGVDWEPAERVLNIGPVCWLVRDDQGRPVDHSPQPGSKELLNEAERFVPGDSQDSSQMNRQGEPWLVAQRRVSAGISRQAAGKHQALVITAAVPLEPVRSALRTLAMTLAGLTAAVLILGLVAGRTVCRRALAPVTRMATAARGMGANDWQERLPAAPAHDELADLGRSFNGLLDRLQEAFERQRRFTGDASHQLRTPLTALLGQVEVCLRNPRTEEEYREVLQRVQAKGRQLAQIVEMLLYLSRADAEAEVAALQQIDLSAWAADHLREWDAHPRRPDLECDADGPCPVRAQPALLGQLLDNLLDNACKYSPPGTPVRVSVRTEDGKAVLAVDDQGEGIAADDLPHVFEPFYRSTRARQAGHPGAGLGLSVARRIAAAFGGSMRAVSVQGRGSRFELVLPLIVPESVRSSVTSALQTAAGGAS